LIYDDLDRALIHALQIDGRVPFSRVAAVLNISPQTVARRYRRLREEGSLRVVGLTEPARAGLTQWMVRLTANPRIAQDVAHALVRRNDTTWVHLTSGGTEIVVTIYDDASAAQQHPLLLRDIPRTGGISAVAAYRVMHSYVGGPKAWPGRMNTLTERQERALRDPASRYHQETGGQPLVLTDIDRRLLNMLHRDGRTSQVDLAASTGRSPVTVARRLSELQRAGAVYFDVELDLAPFRASTRTLLWMAMAPAHLDRVCTAMAEHEELAFLATTTGSTNLAAYALCSDPETLHHYLTSRVGQFDEINSVEATPVLRTLKAGSSKLAGIGDGNPASPEHRVPR
jgi:DNA-binding Lrp family transcriptional regulator